MNTTIPKAAFASAATLKKVHDETRDWVKHRDTVFRAERAFLTNTILMMNRLLEAIPSDPQAEANGCGQVEVSGWDQAIGSRLEFYAQITIPVTSMKIGVLPGMLAKAMDFGFEVHLSQDAEDSSMRTCTLKRTRLEAGKSTILAINLGIIARIGTDEENACRRVQTGTQTVETPTYRIICD